MLCNCLSVCLLSSLFSFMDVLGLVIQLFFYLKLWNRPVLGGDALWPGRQTHQCVCMPATAGRLKPSHIFVFVPGGAKEGVFQLRSFPQLGGQPTSQPPALWEAHVQQPHQRIQKEADQSWRGEASLCIVAGRKKSTQHKWFLLCSLSHGGCCLPSSPALPSLESQQVKLSIWILGLWKSFHTR